MERDTFRLGVRFEQANVLINYGGIWEYDGTFDISPFHYTFCYSDVWAVPSFFILTSKSVTDYDGKVTTTTTYSYDSQYRTLEPTSESVTVSNGDALTKQYTYPFQKTGSTYTAMVNANMQVPVETKTYRANTQTGSTQTLYANYNGLYLPSAYYIGKGTCTPELRIQYDYDSKGNLAYVLKDNTLKTVFLWGYKGMHPVARIEGMTKNEVYGAMGNMVTTLLGNPTDANVYSVNSNSTISANGLATTYTWKPLVGVSSIRKPNLETAYYTYDSMGRLESIKDNGNHTIESYAYNYGTQNYVRMYTMTSASANTYRETTDYYDGLGRKSETVAKAQSPTGQDLVTLTEYDALDRQIREWLPTTFASSGSFVATATFKAAGRTYYGNDIKPYTLVEYETCPSDKHVKKYGPGAAWQNSGKGVETVYSGNNGNDVRIYIASSDDSGLTGNGTYAANQLFVQQTQNEDGNYSYTFTDKEGRMVLERRMEGSVKYDTYYVYDIYGNLAFVLPPAASDVLTSGTWSINTNTTLQNYAYNYRYDSRNRCVEKKLPGCEKKTMTYDTADRLIATQDGVQRDSNISTYYEYDVFGRQTAMGTKTANGTKTPLLLNYYDTYSFFGNLGTSVTNYIYNNSGGSDSNISNAKGLLTGKRVSQLSTPTNYTYTAYHYGERERLVQSHSGNHIGGYNHEYYSYNYTGTIATKKLSHTGYGGTSHTELYTNTYDNADRLTTVTHKLDNNTAVTIQDNTYDAVGRLLTQNPMNAETITYSYNIRNWLTGISSTRFTESLAYNTATGLLTPSNYQWGGNVAAFSWKAGSETNMRTYQLSYDAIDRLTGAAYSGSGNYATTYAYDKMGNFSAMTRYGLQDGGTYGLIDNLSFTYTGNQITRVDDSSIDPTYNAAFNFVDGISQANEYTYDKNGNMTKDLNKNISSIQYNLLNLPQNIAYSSGKSATYIYDAEGKKLRTSYKISPSATAVPTDYCGNMIYENNVLEQILVDGGYITFSGSTPQYHYYLKDHLGNNRVVCSASGTVEQVNHYYPFGGTFGESTNGDAQRFKYNDKEFDRMHGLDWYDYGARHMSADIGRFTTIDPLAEKYYNVSPYAYCANNPANSFDPNGKEILNKFDQYSYTTIRATDIYINKVNDLNNSIIVFAHGKERGSGLTIHEGDNKYLIGNPYEFEKFLDENSETWNNRSVCGDDLKIVLFSCETGADGKFAQTLSMDEAFRDIKIIAPAKDVTIYANGTSSVDNNSSWIEYTNGEVSNRYNGSLLPGTEEFEKSTYWEKTDISKF